MAIAAALSGTAVLHGAPTWAAAASSDSTALEEVIVTARKRTENLQDVPISIDVFTSKDLKNLAISQFEDYATKTPSISFVSAGPGTQNFVMRGVSDGSNSNYSNAAAAAFLIDDMSMNYYNVTPDLHFYDIERIEVLNGPQGTTFGAGAMSGALHFITNKPDASAFSAGVDLDGGKVESGSHNGTAEGFVNIPVIPDWTAIRLSVYSDYHGGFINNLNKSRTWINGTTSTNAEWAAQNYNIEKVTGGRFAIGQKIADGWKASLTYSYQRQLTHGAWDQDPTYGGTPLAGYASNGPKYSLGQNNVVRFGPENKEFYTKTLDFHLDGDVGIGDLVFASTYWVQDDRYVNEYSEYMQYVNTTDGYTGASAQAFTCLTDPISSGGTLGFSGCQVPIQYYDYVNNTQRWSEELRLQSKEGGRLHWLGGLYWEKTQDNYSDYFHMPGLQTNGAQWTYYTSGYTNLTPPPKPDDWYSYVARSDYLQTTEFVNFQFDITPRLKVEAGTVHFQSHFTNFAYGGFWYQPQYLTFNSGGSTKWNSKFGLSYKLTDKVLLYADAAQGFRDGGTNGGLPADCFAGGAPQTYKPDTLNNYEVGWKTAWLDNHLVWNGALYKMLWHDFQTLIFDPNVCRSSSFSANVGNAQVYGGETNINYQITSFWSMQASVSYNDSHLTSNTFGGGVEVGERLPYVPYFAYSANTRYERPLKDQEIYHGYIQWDIAYKGDMYNDLLESGSNGLPRLLQPGYAVMNLRLGLNQVKDNWGMEFYITNLANKDAVIYTNEGNFDLRQTRNEPRVFGLHMSYRFGKPSAGGGD